jgi:glutathione S-transferase
VLKVGDTVLFESAVILEYLDEIHEPLLHPDDPLERARDRSWFTVADVLAQEMFQMMIAVDREALEHHAEVVRRRFTALQEELVGPLWRGDEMCAMDAVTYPALQRLGWLDELHPELDLFGAAGGVRTWRDALAERRAVVASTVPDVRERFLAAVREHGAVHSQPV